jgi:succinate-semialdehyde dehydrogenase / glutarate-semialdehyde dehydrogenase
VHSAPVVNDQMDFDLLIGGQRRAAADGVRIEVRSPHDGRVVGTVPSATGADLEAAVAAAQDAFKGWSTLTAYQRERTLRSAAAYARTKADEVARLMTLEMGKPFAQSRPEVIGACDTIEYYAAEAVRIEGWSSPTEDRAYRSFVSYHPVGVCGLITPWNYPVSLLSWKLGPALTTGCTAVVKPPTVAPLSSLAFCEALAGGGLPAGVVNCLTGRGTSLGAALVNHPHVAKIAMTGSSEVGKRILSGAARFLKKVSLELGGQCPAIVCADADLDLAAKVITYKAFRNSGQSCSSMNRVFIHESVHDSLVGKLRAMAATLRLGDGLSEPDVDLGPMATSEGVEKTKAHLVDAVAHGATVLCGGTAPSEPAFARGNYFLPTLLTGCTPEMRLMREETFGPVLPVASFSSLDEAIALANQSDYGLVAYLFTRDLRDAHLVSEGLEAGSVCVNHGAVNTSYAPYAGWKESGYGVELSRRAVFEYLKPKHIKIAL